MDEDSRIAAVEEVPERGTLLFTMREGFDREEAMLTRLSDGTIVAWRNACPHWTDVRLDKGSGASFRDDELICQKHGAAFESDSGLCTHGPCEGAYLDDVDVTVHDGGVYLTEEGYAFDGQGPSADRDLSSRNRIDFTGN